MVRRSYCIALAAGTVHSTQWSQILAQNRDFCLPPPAIGPPLGGGSSRRNIAMPFGVAKQFNDMIIRFDRIHERNGWTDTQTDTAWRLMHRAAKRTQLRTPCRKFLATPLVQPTREHRWDQNLHLCYWAEKRSYKCPCRFNFLDGASTAACCERLESILVIRHLESLTEEMLTDV